MLQWWAEFSQKPFVAHLLRAVERFNVRGGIQLAAAVTYFSVLALVPILMLAFSALGLTLTVLRPEALGTIENWIKELIDADSDFGGQLYAVIANALTNWAATGLVALGVIIWVSSGWMGNLKRAARLLMRTDVDAPGKLLPMPLDVLVNFAGLIGLLVGVFATFAAAVVATSLGATVGDQLGLGNNPGWTWVLRIGSGLLSLAAGTVMFRLLFGWFAPTPVPRHLAWVGASIGSLGLVVLQTITGYLVGAFSRNLTAALFGPIIILMLFLNLFATLILYIAAWLATAEIPPPEPVAAPAIEPAPVAAERPGELYVSSEVAQKSLGIGLGTGYVVGAATGLGAGALLTALLNGLFRRKS